MIAQSEALRLADELSNSHLNHHINHAAAAELRRLHEEITQLRHAAAATNRCIADLVAQRYALLEALKLMIDHAEFWINHHQKRHMSEQEFKVWLALGHESNAMLSARALARQHRSVPRSADEPAESPGERTVQNELRAAAQQEPEGGGNLPPPLAGRAGAGAGGVGWHVRARVLQFASGL